MSENRTNENNTLPASDPDHPRFTPEVLDRTVIAIPLLRQLNAEREGTAAPRVHRVMIDLNLDYPGGRERSREVAQRRVQQAIETAQTGQFEELQGINLAKSAPSQQYLFARLEAPVIRELVRLDAPHRGPAAAAAAAAVSGAPDDDPPRAIYRIWPDFPIRPLTTESVRIVKADAARAAFSAFGEEIVWAVLDSGIDATHPHFARHHNLEDLPAPVCHRDFTSLEERPLTDAFGHGTHVAGIIGGEMRGRDEDEDEARDATDDQAIIAVSRRRDEHGEVDHDSLELETISGMAPAAKLVSLKVLDGNGNGEASNLIAAIAYIQEINGYGRRIRIQGVNMSVGYDFDPEWFACGQSPLCVEVDRLVRSGVVVVAAAGNTGYGWNATTARGSVASGMDLTINDPGNAELAITVGSTHRTSPHVYGVSYFSSKGPTGDGRLKPDLVAPGEKIISCAAGRRRDEVTQHIQAPVTETTGLYVEDSGTSMAAPHVSGVIAAFLSIRPEFVGRPEEVKRIFLSTATDLKRDTHFQGHGLVDLMRAIQSI